MPALLTATDCTNHVHLIVGHNPLASSRVHRSLELGAKVKLLAPADAQLHYNLQQKVDDGKIEWIRKEEVTREDLLTQGRSEVEGAVDAVFVTLPVGCAQCAQISNLCKRLRIPVNVADAPALCTFTLLSTHTDGPLQIGVTTSGRGCKLASRIRREIATSLPADLGAAVDRLGRLRRAIWNEDNKEDAQSQAQKDGTDSGIELLDEDEDSGQDANFNRLITPEDFEAVKTRRVRWLSQMCEYWPLARLCALTEPELDSLLRDYTAEKDGYFSGLTGSTLSSGIPIIESDITPTDSPVSISNDTPLTHPSFIPPLSPSRGTIHLLGSGPGDPALLTTAALTAINRATLILADKLVPAPVLDLIPRRTPIHIARKFPGNADRAQDELQSMALAALQRGESVVRLKQGDPFLFGRGAEEVEFFKGHGYDAIVVPGITSALSAPLFAGIPVTHRGVSDQVLVATGTGRKGASPDPPEYRKNQTVVFLMALHRLTDLVDSLCVGKSWPKNVPCAVIERASCADQRVVRATLGSVVAAIEEVGSRPPGLIVVGWVCEVGLKESEKADIQKGLWKVEEGFKGY